jgi:hypothetical protein
MCTLKNMQVREEDVPRCEAIYMQLAIIITSTKRDYISRLSLLINVTS